MTEFFTKCSILGMLWFDYSDDPDFAEFVSMEDLSLPLAFLINDGKAEATSSGIILINETFQAFLDMLGLEDTGFDNLDDVLAKADEVPFDN